MILLDDPRQLGDEAPGTTSFFDLIFLPYVSRVSDAVEEVIVGPVRWVVCVGRRISCPPEGVVLAVMAGPGDGAEAFRRLLVAVHGMRDALEPVTPLALVAEGMR